MASRAADQPTTDASRARPGDAQQGVEDHSRVSPWEWLVAAIGLILVVSTLCFMFYEVLAGGDAPPQIALHVASIQPVGVGYLVTFTATNQGDITAAAVVIEGQLGDDTSSTETSTATIAYLPAHSSREGGLYFSQDPRQFHLELLPKGYELP